MSHESLESSSLKVRDLGARIGIFGGSFDPPHEGHRHIACAAAEAESLNAVIFMPNRQNPLKAAAPCADDQHRLEMLRLATAGRPDFFVSELELRSPAPSFTVDTLRRLHEETDPSQRLYFILGADSLEFLPQWHRAADIFSLATVVPVARRSFPLGRIDSLEGALPPECIAQLKAHFVDVPPVDVSATAIRAALAAGAREIPGLAPAVARYIAEHCLYALTSPG